MLISTRTQKIVLNLRDTRRVTEVIPTAKVFQYKGHELVAVPHRLDEVRVLRNLGFAQTPSPVAYHYDWPRNAYKVPNPFVAQVETTKFLTLNPKAFVLNDLGTGKTLSTLWAFDYLRSIGEAKKMLVISPLSTLERTWADEIFQHFNHLTWAVLHGTKERRLKLLESDVDIYLINHDGIKVKAVEQMLCLRPDIDTIVVDEVASFRNASTDRWKALNRICAGRARVWGLTGTPTPNEPTDAWAQCRLISPERVPKYFGKFRDMVMRQFGPFKWVPRADATDIVADAMQPAIRFSRDQCVDLPPCMYQDREVPMTKEQQDAYKTMLVKLMMEDAHGEQVTALNEAVKASKLVQIACGVVYGNDGSEILLPAGPRIAEVIEVIQQAAGKVIVFVPFTSTLKHLVGELEAHFTVGVVDGSVSSNKRSEVFRAFQNDAHPRVLVAQPAAMSHGLTLTAANTIVWYAPTTSNEIYEQANGRITRPGQTQSQFIVRIAGSPIERRIYQRLETKQGMQGALLEEIRGDG